MKYSPSEIVSPDFLFRSACASLDSLGAGGDVTLAGIGQLVWGCTSRHLELASSLHSSQARTASDPLFFFLVTATIAGHARPAERWMADFDRTP